MTMTYQSQIEEWLCKKKSFIGCFPSKNLSKMSFPKYCCFAVNIEKHWVGICIEDNFVYYFDSLLTSPMRKVMFDFLQKQKKVKGKKIFIVKRKIQNDDSILCGVFVTLFLFYVNSVNSFTFFMRNFFVQNLKQNDKIALNMLNKIIL